MKKTLRYITLPLLLLLNSSAGNSASSAEMNQTGTRARSIVDRGYVVMEFERDLFGESGMRAQSEDSRRETVRFAVRADSFFTILLFNDVLRGPEPGSMNLLREKSGHLPLPLNASADQLILEKTAPGEPFELIVRDGKTGFVFFNIEGALFDYDTSSRLLTVNEGRLLLAPELAKNLGRPAEAGSVVGNVSMTLSMSPIEVTTFVNGAAQSSALPPRGTGSGSALEGAVPGPDIVVGDMSALQQFGSSGGEVGLAIGTTSCNNGDQEVHFFQLPNPDHSVVSQNLYRMSGGASNSDRFEQIGQSWVKHTFGADQDNACGFDCIPAANATTLGVGCSDPYLASQNGSQTDHVGALGSRAWVNPFTGAFPGSSPRPESHAGHTHTGTSHRILVKATDLNTSTNPGATYYAEVQYDSPQEYAWCQAHPGECNMFNNASYRRYNVTGTTSFSFSPAGSTVRKVPATGAWTGATTSMIEPAPGSDGRAFVAYKVTGPVGGLWHYEYAIHNQNLDRSIQSFAVPLGCGITISNAGFHAPANHPGFPNDGTVGNAGFSNTAWTPNET
ncbi:MAG TPA: hypothetical protein VK474_04940, partial [Chthoniobacterales bacterium]|nr:hypothetical protein [Chthoniobacterales bacterium]